MIENRCFRVKKVNVSKWLKGVTKVWSYVAGVVIVKECVVKGQEHIGK